MSSRDPVPEATLTETEHGRAVTAPGWYVLNVADACAFDSGISSTARPAPATCLSVRATGNARSS